MNLHRDPNYEDFFADLVSDWQKVNHKWKPISMNIKFKTEKLWSKIYDDVKIDNSEFTLEKIKASTLINGNNFVQEKK